MTYQVDGVDGSLEIRFVHLHEIQVALFGAASEVMPHQVVQDALCHAFRPEIPRVHRLVAPFDPAGLRRAAVHQTQRTDLVGVCEAEANQDICSGADAETDD